MNNTELFLRHNFVRIPNGMDRVNRNNSLSVVATLQSNLMHYGYILDNDAMLKIQNCSLEQIHVFWNSLKPSLEKVTGADKKMDKFVVYKNFPKEVMEMSDAQYWINQILMYIGVPNKYFTQEEVKRDPLMEKVTLKVLRNTYIDIDEALYNFFEELKANKSSWSDNQLEEARYILSIKPDFKVDVSNFGFIQNGIKLAKIVNEKAYKNIITIREGMHVLKFAAALSQEEDINKAKFHFNRNQRRILLGLLESCKNLEEDIGFNPTVWKRFMKSLRPGDYPLYKRVIKAYDLLYTGKYKAYSYNSLTDVQFFKENPTMRDDVIKRLISHAGDFMRKFHALYAIDSSMVVNGFIKSLHGLNTYQILKFKKYINTINQRNKLIYTPKGSWLKLKIEDNNKNLIKDSDLEILNSNIDKIIAKRLSDQKFGRLALDERVKNIKLQTNGQELASYGRGTVFNIPENIKFIRTASYWKELHSHNVWFDNGWNFFDHNWNNIFTCCWDSNVNNRGAVFSGDPTNSKDMQGRACQIIDLYLDDLQEMGVRYAVWNILCFSHIKFSDAEDVLATLQMGEEPQQGNLYEPSRAHFVFPLKGDALTKYIAYIDIKERKIVYLDLSLKAPVSSAKYSEPKLSEIMPALLEHIDTIPSVHDLFAPYIRKAKNIKTVNTFILYDDNIVESLDGQKAYIFNKSNDKSKYDELYLNDILKEKD